MWKIFITEVKLKKHVLTAHKKIDIGQSKDFVSEDNSENVINKNYVGQLHIVNTTNGEEN